jgi:hypothetical protein
MVIKIEPLRLLSFAFGNFLRRSSRRGGGRGGFGMVEVAKVDVASVMSFPCRFASVFHNGIQRIQSLIIRSHFIIAQKVFLDRKFWREAYVLIQLAWLANIVRESLQKVS